MGDGCRLMARKGQKTRETKRQEKKRRLGRWREEVLDLRELVIQSSYPVGSRKGSNHQLRCAEEPKRQSTLPNVTCSRLRLCAVANLHLADK